MAQPLGVYTSPQVTSVKWLTPAKLSLGYESPMGKIAG
jgi:hypothetical protein